MPDERFETEFESSPTTPPEPPAQPGVTKEKINVPLVVALMTGVIAVGFELYGINTAMPIIKEDLGHREWYAWAFTAFVIGQMIAIVTAGRLSDKIGAFKPLAFGTALFTLGLILAGASDHMLWFLFARLLQGIGGGAMSLTLMVVVAEAFTERQRPRIMMIFSFCYLLPAFAGPPVAGWIATHLSWHWVFWSIIPIMVLAGVLGARPMWRVYRNREVRSEENTNPVPYWSAFVIALGAALIQLAGQQLNWSAIAIVIVGIACVVFTLPRLMPPGIFKMGRGLPSVMGVRFTLAGAFYAAESFLTLMLTEERGLTATKAGLALTGGAVGWALGSFIQSQSWLRIRRDQIISLGALMAGFGLSGLTWFALWPTAPLYLVLISVIVTGFGMGCGMASTSLAVMTLSPMEQVGRNTSSLQVSDALGSAVFAGVAGTLFAGLQDRIGNAETFGWIFGVQTGVLVLALILSLRIGPVRNEASLTG